MDLNTPIITWNPEQFSAQMIYDLISAVRGPDYKGRSLETEDDVRMIKWHITARVRGILFGPVRSAHMADLGRLINLEPMTAEGVDALRAAASRIHAVHANVWPGWRHCRGHLIDAVHASMDHPIWAGRYEAIHAALTAE